jgi:hypothetical protein
VADTLIVRGVRRGTQTKILQLMVDASPEMLAGLPPDRWVSTHSTF